MRGKHRRLRGVLLAAACCLAVGLRASASNGSAPAPVSLSYLQNTFLPELEKGIAARVKEGTKGVYDAALAKVDARAHTAGGITSPSGGWTVTEAPRPAVFNGGDTLTLDEGGSFLWLAGVGTAGTGLVDVTAGAEVPQGGRLTAGHRYLNGQEGMAAQAAVRSDKAQAAAAGRWNLAPGGQAVTHFYDLCRTDWFYDGVRWALDQGIFKGTSSTEFTPDGIVDRATLATLLYRLAGNPELPYQGIFSDIPSGQWYTAAVEWAAANGIAEDRGTGSFSPTDTVDREELVQMFYHLAGYLKMDTTASASLDGFADGAQVRPDARDAVSWAVGAGVMKGGDGSLQLRGTSTRAQVALMIQRFQTLRGMG